MQLLKWPNENKMSDGYRERSANRSGKVLIIGKCDRAAGSRSLHRLVRWFALRGLETPNLHLLCRA
jgi:hypothetical protein